MTTYSKQLKLSLLLILCVRYHFVPMNCRNYYRFQFTGIGSRNRPFLGSRRELDKVMGTMLIHFNRSMVVLNYKKNIFFAPSDRVEPHSSCPSLNSCVCAKSHHF